MAARGGFKSLFCCFCGSRRRFQKLQTFESGEELEPAQKAVQTEQPKSLHTATTGPSQLPQGENPTPDSGKDEEGDTQGEESSISSVEKESPPAPIAAEEESLLLDLERESTSPSPSVTNTPVLPREPLTPLSVPVPKVGSEELTENNSIVVKEESDNTATVKTQAPSTIINPLASVENTKPQEATSTIVKEEFNSETSCVNKEEKELKQEVQEESFFKEEVPVVSLSKSEEGEVSPSADKDALLEAVNLTLTNIMERAEKVVVEQVSVNMASIKSEHANPNTEVITSLVEKIQAPAEREATPDSDGSMQGSSGSEALEEALKDAGIVNGDKHEEKSNDKSEKGDKKEEKTGKSKKKEDKTIDHILRALSSLQTTEEKLAALCKKYADLHEEHRVLQSTHKQHQRKLAMVTREKDQLQTEHTKAVMAKSKLEGLCRELQKHNQVIRQESLQRAREEDEKRKEISNKFQSTITEIQQQMTDHHDRNLKLREENQELAGKLKKFIEQYEVREKQVEKVMQHRELEQKLADAKLEQASAYLAEEQEKSRKEHLVAVESSKRAQLLETQLSMYKERYEEFQSTINRSNDMFQKFKTEMEKMTKRIKKLEKDGAAWKNKWENANKALLEMAEEKTLYDKEKPLLLNKIKKLESLCRAMQAERLGRKAAEASNIDITKIDEDLPDVLGGPTSPSKSNPRESKPETDSPPESGPDGESLPSEPSGEKQEDDPQAAPTEQKSEEPPVDSNPQPQPEAQTTET
ncbi:uncharacterized protein LOC111103499 isoform X2 [Crassostrea virginica]